MSSESLLGGSSDATPASSGTSEEQRRKTRLFLSSLVVDKKQEEFHCLVNKERLCRSGPTDPVTILKESVLHLFAIEADCEQFFRIPFQVAKIYRRETNTLRIDNNKYPKSCDV